MWKERQESRKRAKEKLSVNDSNENDSDSDDEGKPPKKKKAKKTKNSTKTKQKVQETIPNNIPGRFVLLKPSAPEKIDQPSENLSKPKAKKSNENVDDTGRPKLEISDLEVRKIIFFTFVYWNFFFLIFL